jgi:dienelactone hydrolase
MKILLSLWLGFYAYAHAESITALIAYQSPNGPGQQIGLKAELHLPKSVPPPYKVIILQHSSGPDVWLSTFRGRTDSIAKRVGELAVQHNYAVIFTDSFTPRDIRESHRIDSKDIGSREITRDLFFLIRELQRDPRFDKENLFFFGHSLGGAVARDVSYPETWEKARWLRNKATPFKAVVSSAPGCHLNREGKVGQALKIFVGADDDWTPPKPCMAFVERQKNLGATDVEIELIPNAGHTYSSSGTGWNARAISFRGCTENTVTVTRDGRFFQAGESITLEEYKRRCHTVGATSMGPQDKAQLLAEKVVHYFNKY